MVIGWPSPRFDPQTHRLLPFANADNRRSPEMRKELTDVADEPAASLKGALSRRQMLTRAGVAVAGTTAAAAIGGTTTAGALAIGSSTTI
jgi:hypothetical protein